VAIATIWMSGDIEGEIVDVSSGFANRALSAQPRKTDQINFIIDCDNSKALDRNLVLRLGV
jgi:hypothetical protein